MTINLEPKLVFRRNSYLIIGAGIAISIILVINAVISGYFLRRNTVEDRAEQI
jgi:hypothetical protein